MIQEYHFWVSIYLYLYLYLYLSIAPKMKAGTSTDTCTPTFLSSLLHSSQKVESNQVSVDGWTDKQNTGHTCNAILFNLNKDGNADVSYHMDEPWGQQAKWNRPIKEASTLRSHSQEVPAVGPLRDRKQNGGCQGLGERGDWLSNSCCVEWWEGPGDGQHILPLNCVCENGKFSATYILPQ